MAKDKSNRNMNREGSPRPRKMTLSDKRRNARNEGYQRLADIIFNDGEILPKR